MKDQTAIRAQNLHKKFGDVYAVNGVSFEVRAGTIFSLLGPNGAGKSTTISMLSGLLRPSQGDAQVDGQSVIHNPQGVKEALGVVPQEIALYPDLSARENLEFWGKMYGLRGAGLKERVDEVLEITGLTNRQKDKVGTFSGGMKRRVNIGAALVHQPKVIIMDEPTVGIDPQSRRNILDNVKELNRKGMTVLYTTHYMEEAQELSDQIAIMDQGKVIACGSHAELVRIVGEMDRIDLSVASEAAPPIESWRKTAGVHSLTTQDGRVSLLVEDSNLVLPRLFDAAWQARARISSVNVFEPNLEAVFLHLTGKALRD